MRFQRNTKVFLGWIFSCIYLSEGLSVTPDLYITYLLDNNPPVSCLEIKQIASRYFLFFCLFEKVR